MARIVFIGGGSAKFVRTVAVDLFSYEELSNSEIVLMDVNSKRLERAGALVQKIISEQKIGAKVHCTLDRRKALEGADYVIVTIMVGGYDCYRSDIAIPAKYGVLQAISDTTGPGAVMRILRTAPVMKGIAHDLRELAPGAWILNYANPMAMNVWILLDAGHERTVGLCHSIQGCCRRIAEWLGIADELQYTAAGINHINFYLTLGHNGKDIYPELRGQADRIVRQYPAERTRFELLKYLGYFPAEGAHHQSEYFPWFRKNEAMVRHYAVPTFTGYENDFNHYKEKAEEAREQIAGRRPISLNRSSEFAARIIHSLETGNVRTFYGNVRNAGLIDNLPDQAVVEVPCVVSTNGIFPCQMGPIPIQLAAAMSPHIFLQELATKGVENKDRVLLRQALQADPLTGAILTLAQTEDMLSELLAANKNYLQDW